MSVAGDVGMPNFTASFKTVFLLWSAGTPRWSIFMLPPKELGGSKNVDYVAVSKAAPDGK